MSIISHKMMRIEKRITLVLQIVLFQMYMYIFTISLWDDLQELKIAQCK